MRVTFRKLVEQRVTQWDAIRGERIRVPGTTMALGRGGLPHDLEQLVVEGALGVQRGFWGSVAAGGTFKSIGRKRTRPGRAVIAKNRDEIRASEGVVHEHVRRWRAGEPTPAAGHLARVTDIWAALGDGGEVTIEWPTLRILDGGAR